MWENGMLHQRQKPRESGLNEEKKEKLNFRHE